MKRIQVRICYQQNYHNHAVTNDNDVHVHVMHFSSPHNTRVGIREVHQGELLRREQLVRVSDSRPSFTGSEGCGAMVGPGPGGAICTDKALTTPSATN